jgi:SNF2 family DNA or RNA helicase
MNRDGQKRPVYIYRLLTACTIDEKIYQVSLPNQSVIDD